MSAFSRKGSVIKAKRKETHEMEAEYVTVAEAARRLHVTPPAIHNWRQRFAASFPKPSPIVAGVNVYSWRELCEWIVEREAA